MKKKWIFLFREIEIQKSQKKKNKSQLLPKYQNEKKKNDATKNVLE